MTEAGPSTPSAPTGDFASDPRIHFDQQSGKWAFEADDGTEMEWDLHRGAWVPVLEDSLVHAQQAAYSVAGVDESAPAAPVLAREQKRRKAESTGPKEPKKPRVPKPPRGTTAIFVSRLPLSTTAPLLASVFSKAGLILEDAEGELRIKMYKDEQGRFKGEALIVYLQEASVDLAVRLFDETELELGSGEGSMGVKKAEWEKKDGEDADRKPADGARSGGKTDLDKQKAGKRAEKLKQKLTDWSSASEDEETAVEAARALKYNRLVVLKGMFTLQELEDDATLLIELKEDVREECETLGEVTNVTLYDLEADGIITVRFKEPLAAQACIAKMNGRFFSGRSIHAFLFTGNDKYKKSGAGVSLEGTGFEEEEDQEREKDRQEKYQTWLENGGKEE